MSICLSTPKATQGRPHKMLLRTLILFAQREIFLLVLLHCLSDRDNIPFRKTNQNSQSSVKLPHKRNFSPLYQNNFQILINGDRSWISLVPPSSPPLSNSKYCNRISRVGKMAMLSSPEAVRGF